MLNSLVQIFSPIEVIDTKLCVSFKWRYLCFVLFSIAKVYAYVGDALAKCLLKDGASKRSPYEGHFVPCRSQLFECRAFKLSVFNVVDTRNGCNSR